MISDRADRLRPAGVRRLIGLMKRGIVIIAVVLVAGAAAAYWSLRGAPAPAPTRNVVLIVLDTVRADRLGCYGNTLGLTPEIDRFAGGAVRFDQAYSHAPWTLPSIASLFTSRYPEQHRAGGRLGAFSKLAGEVDTVAEVFREAGAATGAVINVLFLTAGAGMTQGFDFVDADAHDSNTEVRRAGPTTDAALRWLDQDREGPFFLLVHYFDAHLIYDPPAPFRERFAAPQDRYTDDFVFGTRGDMIALRNGKPVIQPRMIGRLEQLYNGEIAYLDSEVGRLLAGISERGLDSNTAVVITADHGEEFLEHGGFEHGHTLYDELLHVPLIVRPPDLALGRAGTTVSSTVRLIDVAPTLCKLAGIAGSPDFEGVSLTDMVDGAQGPDRPVLSQGNMWGPSGDAWRRGDVKLIRTHDPDRVSLFKVGADPKEWNDLADELIELRVDMLADLDLIKRKLSADAVDGQAADFSDEEIDKLRTLGYINDEK